MMEEAGGRKALFIDKPGEFVLSKARLLNSVV